MADQNTYQLRYWKELVQLKMHILYLEEFLLQTEMTDRKINMFLAVTSNASICGWAIWQKYSFAWALVIAASQLLNALKSFLPYAKRLKALPHLLHDLEEVLLLTEKHWFAVAEGEFSEKKIHEMHIDIKARKAKAIWKHIGTSPLPENIDCLARAKAAAEVYFQNFYPVEEFNEQPETA